MPSTIRTTARYAAALLTAVTALVLGALPAAAQLSGDTAAIPEAAPKNWSIQFIAEPTVAVVALAIVACIVWYAVKMIKLRYPRA
jgi:hypothetical protein